LLLWLRTPELKLLSFLQSISAFLIRLSPSFGYRWLPMPEHKPFVNSPSYSTPLGQV